MKEYRCYRCHKIFKTTRKYKTNAGNRKICRKCMKSRDYNKGKEIMSPKKRLRL